MKNPTKKKPISKKPKKIQAQKIDTPDDLSEDFGLPHKSDPLFMLLKTIGKLLSHVEELMGIDSISKQIKKNKTNRQKLVNV